MRHGEVKCKRCGNVIDLALCCQCKKRIRRKALKRVLNRLALDTTKGGKN